MSLSEKEKNKVIIRYSERFNEFGYSPKTLGWDKGKQGLRFDVLTSGVDLKNKSVIDIGCGFGDLNKVLKLKFGEYHHTGIDVVECLIQQGNEIFSNNYTKLICGDFLNYNFDEKFDYAIASGIFNFKLSDIDNYSYIESIIEKALNICTIGIAFDFLSDKVDFQYEHTFHSRPEEILRIAYKYSRRVILRNDYMPFEFCIFIFKDDSFDPKNTVFDTYKNFIEL